MAQRSDPARDQDALPAPQPGIAHSVRGSRAIRTLMMLLTGAAGTLWFLAQIEPTVKAKDWIWLLIIIVLTGWPSYWAWCSHHDTLGRLAEVERRCATAYNAGYSNGYLDALASRVEYPAGQAMP